MRFPDDPLMKRIFDLFKKIELDDKIIPYVMTLDRNLNYFNGKCLTNKEVEDQGPDPFKTGIKDISDSTSKMVSKQFELFKNEITEAIQNKDENRFRKAWKHLMKYDGYSTRGFMTLVKEIEENEENEENGEIIRIAKKQYSNQVMIPAVKSIQCPF